MRLQRIVLIALSLFISSTGMTEEKRFYVESDPFAFLMQGYSIHAGMQFMGFRPQVGIFAATIPKAMRNNPNFENKMRGFGFKLDYTGTSPGGWFGGVEVADTDLFYVHMESTDSINRKGYLIGVRGGYRFQFENGFFITPWIGLNRNISDISDIEVNSDVYRERQWQVFPTAHFGYQF